MGLTRLGSDGSLPRSDYAAAVTVTFAVDNTAVALIGVKTLVQRVIIEAPAGNAAAVTVGPSSAAALKSLAAGAEWIVEAAPGASFDLSQWYAKTATHTGTTLVLTYQPA